LCCTVDAGGWCKTAEKHIPLQRPAGELFIHCHARLYRLPERFWASMNIVHVAESFAGGVLDFIAELARGIPEFRHTIIYGRREDTPQSFKERFPPETLFHYWRHATREVSPVLDLRALLELVALLKGMTDADVVHLHSSKAGFLGRVACRMLGMRQKVVYSPHGAAFMRRDVSLAKANTYRGLEQFAARLGGRVVCSCRSEQEEFLKAGIRAASINNGIACSSAVRHESSSPALTIGTAGRATAQKDPALFNTIASHFVHDRDIKFIWIGDGELRGQLTSPNIQVTGWLEKSEFSEKISQMDIFLSTSRWEGLPLSTLHVMCAGKPLVLNDCVGNRDLVRDGVNGFLFSRSDEAVQRILELASDRKKRGMLGAQSRDMVLREFSVAGMIAGYSEIYRGRG
jgi:glycosyltransferase involved in cell wall biosynthesis